jgi:hypothetical protein
MRAATMTATPPRRAVAGRAQSGVAIVGSRVGAPIAESQRVPYAIRTKVTVEKTRADIEHLLAKYGANRFAYFVEPKRAVILFEVHDRRLRFALPLPDERLVKQRWRALLLCIKAKLEAVASKIETFDEAFLSHVVLPNGDTIYERTAPQLAQIAKGQDLPPLLPGP